MVGLGVLPNDEQGGSSSAFDVSADGNIVVGRTATSLGSQAFIWDSDQNMRKLQEVLETDLYLDLTGWRLQEARAISDDGLTVVGFGINPDGNTEGWVADLTPPVFGDLNDDGVADNLDITPFLIALTVGGNEETFLAEVPGGKFFHGDVDHDGFVSNTDITPFIGLLTAAGSNAAAVPEPGSLVCIALALMMGRRRWRRRLLLHPRTPTQTHLESNFLSANVAQSLLRGGDEYFD